MHKYDALNSIRVGSSLRFETDRRRHIEWRKTSRITISTCFSLIVISSHMLPVFNTLRSQIYDLPWDWFHKVCVTKPRFNQLDTHSPVNTKRQRSELGIGDRTFGRDFENSDSSQPSTLRLFPTDWQTPRRFNFRCPCGSAALFRGGITVWVTAIAQVPYLGLNLHSMNLEWTCSLCNGGLNSHLLAFSRPNFYIYCKDSAPGQPVIKLFSKTTVMERKSVLFTE